MGWREALLVTGRLALAIGSAIVAVGAAYLVSSGWLSGLGLRLSLPWNLFAGFAVLVLIASVTYQTVKGMFRDSGQ